MLLWWLAQVFGVCILMDSSFPSDKFSKWKLEVEKLSEWIWVTAYVEFWCYITLLQLLFLIKIMIRNLDSYFKSEIMYYVLDLNNIVLIIPF